MSVDPEDIEPDGIPGTRWNRAALTATQEPAAVDGITGQFAYMDAYWRAASGESFPIADGISDARVEVAVAGEPRQGLPSTSLLFRWPTSALVAGVRRDGPHHDPRVRRHSPDEGPGTNDLPGIGEAHGGMLEI
ncbi:hypothetical protein [Arthrobacter sp. AQ5-05]|uniref:hypothetical protein n=1 Tax=Arthrobacter sp. AQ5-05 TaxID=2184581 RepID=UPI0011BE0F07|nr:hypothetical protein [Arthrobacter sp. AQ5-05]